MMDFEELMDGTVREVANPALPGRFEERISARLRNGGVTVHLVAANRWSGNAFGIFGAIWDNARAVLWPRREPALVLESRPVAAVDRMATERNSRPMIGAVLVHAAVILVIGWVVEARVGVVSVARPVQVVALDAAPPKALPRAETAGGGGGQRGATPATRGHLPKFAPEQIVPPKAPPLEPPKIAIEPTVAVQKELKMADNTLPNVGMPNAPLVGMSLGSGSGSGIGPGSGAGYGPGAGGNAGGGLRHVGGSVSGPQVLFQPEPEFSEEARKAKFSGNVQVYLWVDEHGNPTHVRVLHGVGLGLDEKAAAAVRQYKFKPAMENGRPVTVEMYVEVVFQIF